MELFVLIIDSLLIFGCANSFFIVRENLFTAVPILMIVFLGNILPMYTKKRFPGKRLRLCNHGVKCLKIFLISVTMSVFFQGYIIYSMVRSDWKSVLFSAIFCTVIEAIIFWNGIISVYVSSVQLGIKMRVLGLVFGYVPVANIICLILIIRIVNKECDFELKKHMVNVARRDEMVCATKYPILLVHGVFFRDIEFLNYWGRIPNELEKNGARIFYGEHESAASVKDSGEQLAERIKKILAETGSEKVNIIAHSKGGIDSRYAISQCGIEDKVASLTTVSTPHRGCFFADYLLEKIPVKFKNRIAETYNDTMKKLGDKSPDFLAAVYDLVPEKCEEFNRELTVPETIFCQSVGSVMRKASSGKFPLWLSYPVAKHFDGRNDGLVGEYSFDFGQKHIMLENGRKRGISHGDMIDLNRENIDGFDVREFYVELVSDLKKRGC